MAIPDFQSLMLPMLKLAADGQEHTMGDAVEQLAQEFQLSDDDREELLPSGVAPRFYNRVGWTMTYLKKAGLLKGVGRGSFQVTDRGRALLDSKPSTIDLRFLKSRFPEVLEFRNKSSAGGVAEEDRVAVFDLAKGSWTQRPGMEERIRAKLERSIPNETTRREALGLLAFASEVEHERLLRASLACGEVLEVLRGGSPKSGT